MRILILIGVLLLVPQVSAQDPRSASKVPTYAVVPAHNVLVAVAAQPNCPLLIEDAKFLRSTDRTTSKITYKVRNVSSKPIALFTIDDLNSEGAGGTLTVWSASSRKRSMLMPGETLEVYEPGSDFEIVSITKEILDELKPEREMKVVHILLVNKVEFAEGETYKDEETSQALSVLFKKLSR